MYRCAAIGLVGLATVLGTGLLTVGTHVHLGPDQVDGPLLAIGDQVTVAGTVDGDLWVLAEDLTVTGTIRGDINTIAGSVTVDGRVNGELDALAGLIVLGTGAQAASIDADAGAGLLSGDVAGQARIDGPVLFITSTTHITGDLIHGATEYRNFGQIDGAVRQVPDRDPQPVLVPVASGLLPTPLGPVP